MQRHPQDPSGEVVKVDHPARPSPFFFVCEHASAHMPAPWGDLGLPPEARLAHIAWDPGALGVAEELARHFAAPLVRAGLSRLIYDLNRPPDSPGAMAERSEVWDIPGNRHLPPEERIRRTETIYNGFHAALAGALARVLATGTRPVFVTVHSFTPVWFGKPREVQLGFIHDADPAFARACLAAARRTGLTCALNAPYSAADGVTHTLKLHATPYGLPHVMLEIRNDLIETASAQARMADTLASVLREAWDSLAAPAAGDG